MVEIKLRPIVDLKRGVSKAQVAFLRAHATNRKELDRLERHWEKRGLPWGSEVPRQASRAKTRERYPDIPDHLDLSDPQRAHDQLEAELDNMTPTQAVQAMRQLDEYAQATWSDAATARAAKVRRIRRAQTARRPTHLSIDATIASHHARAVALGVASTLTAAQWSAILESHLGLCAYCGSTAAQLTIDHVLPVSKCGPNTAENVVPACLGCNSSKGTKSPFDWLESKDMDSDAAFTRINNANARRKAAR